VPESVGHAIAEAHAVKKSLETPISHKIIFSLSESPVAEEEEEEQQITEEVAPAAVAEQVEESKEKISEKHRARKILRAPVEAAFEDEAACEPSTKEIPEGTCEQTHEFIEKRYAEVHFVTGFERHASECRKRGAVSKTGTFAARGCFGTSGCEEVERAQMRRWGDPQT